MSKHVPPGEESRKTPARWTRNVIHTRSGTDESPPASFSSGREGSSFLLPHRSPRSELMDTEPMDAPAIAGCLRDLAAVNRLTLAHGPTLGWLARATRSLPPGAELSLLDVACGGGDALRAIAAWARRRGLRPRLLGLDLNPLCLAAARAATPAHLGITYLEGDALALDLPHPPDFITSALFTHHLPDEAVARFLAAMHRTARRGWLVNDLHRHPLALQGFRLLGAAMRWHPVVRHDGAISVARSFRPPEWHALLARARVPGSVWRVPPFRLCVGHLHALASHA